MSQLQNSRSGLWPRYDTVQSSFPHLEDIPWILVYKMELHGGSSDNEGQVFFGNRPVCDNNWDIEDANLVCKLLGWEIILNGEQLDNQINSKKVSNCSQSNKVFWIWPGTTKLHHGQCPLSWKWVGVVGLLTWPREQLPSRRCCWGGVLQSLGYTLFISQYSFCSFDFLDFAIRLEDGDAPHKGNVFIGYYSVCSDGWDIRDANVACKMMG